MFNLIYRLLACAALSLALPLWAAEPIRIGVLSSPLKPWQPLAAELKRQIPERDFVIEMYDHSGLEQAVESRRLDFVLTNPGHYLLMQRRSGLSSPLATLVNEDDGHPLDVIGGAIICRAERSDINGLKDIRGKTVAYLDHGAMGGYQTQAYELALKGMDLQRDMQWLKVGASHTKAIEAVLSGKADVGFVRAGQIESMARSGKLDSSKLRVLNLQDFPDFPFKTSTHLYPEWPFSALPSADNFIARRVTAVLLHLDRNPALLHAMQIQGFTIPADYQPVENMLVKLRLPPFDSTPEISFRNIWDQHGWAIGSVLVAIVIILLLSLRLVVSNRRLALEKMAVLAQSDKMRESEQNLKRLNEALSESEERWRFALEGAGDGVWDWDVASGKTMFSKRWKAIVGYAENEFADDFETWMDSLHPEDKQRVVTAVQDYFEGNAAEYAVEFRMRCKDGGWKWILARGMVVSRDAAGKPLRMIGTHADISERRQMQEALESLNRDFVALLENTSDFLYFKDGESRLRFCSQSMALIVGHKGWRELVGKHDLEIFPPETAKIYYEEELPIFRDGVPLLNKVDPYFDAQGNRCWVSTSKWPVFAADGKTVVGIFGISRDITDRKNAEDRLRKERDFAESLIATAPTIVLLLDVQGRIVRINPYLESLTGYKFTEVEGKDWFATFLPDAVQEQTRALFLGAINDIHTHGNINAIVTRSGQERIIEWYDTTLKDAENNTLGLLAIGQDVTERKKMEDALRRSNIDLEQFAYSVSHDMRQPLRAVSGHLQLLQRSLKDKLDENDRVNMEFALEGAQRMDSMIVSLLDYSRVGRKTESKQWIPSRASVDEALNFLSPLIGEVGADVRLGGEWPQVFASRDEMTRLFQNLIGNAIKFREAGQVPVVEVESSVQAGAWRVSVRDHGVGIDPQQIDRLFQFFSRLQSRARFEGTGMGLALCRRIVEHHNGRIWVESEGEGKGSEFIFELPLKAMESGAI